VQTLRHRRVCCCSSCLFPPWKRVATPVERTCAFLGLDGVSQALTKVMSADEGYVSQVEVELGKMTLVSACFTPALPWR
jgi:hypothetical protein